MPARKCERTEARPVFSPRINAWRANGAAQLDAERSVLGAIIVNNRLLVDADVLSKDDFYRDAHQRVFLAIRSLAGQEIEIDLVSLRDELQRRGDLDEVGGPAFISGLVDGIPRGTNVQYYARVLRECSTLRALIGRIDGLRELAYARQTDLIDDAVHDLALAAADVSASRSSARGEAPVLLNMAEVQRQEVRWLWANRLALGAMTLLAAEPGIGKSWLSLEIAARLTTNRELPGGPRLSEGMDVLIMAAEDAPENDHQEPPPVTRRRHAACSSFCRQGPSWSA
jgi:replicative DNA helicase